jgi:hypothetical protein
MAELVEEDFLKELQTAPKYRVVVPENAELGDVIKFLNLLNLHITIHSRLTEEYTEFVEKYPDWLEKVEPEEGVELVSEKVN